MHDHNPGSIDSLLTAWFAVMFATNTRYCVLRNYKHLPKQVGNDLDILIDDSSKDAATSLLRRLAVEQGWTHLVSIPFSSTVAHSFFKDVDAKLLTLHIDIVTDFQYWGVRFFDPESVLNHRRHLRNFYIPSPVHEAVLLVLKDRFFRGSIRKAYQARIHELIPFREEANEIIRLSRLRFALELFSLNFATPLALIQRVAKNFARLFKRWIFPPGKFIVLVGPDGAGKSSVAKTLIEYCNRLYRSTYYFHWLPPLVGSFTNPLVNTAPSPSCVTSGFFAGLFSIVRLSKNSLHALVSYHCRIRPLLFKGCVVIGDRYIYNYLLNPVSVCYTLGKPPLFAFFHFLPKPDFIAVITASPEIILARKQELSRAEIEIQYKSISELRPLCKTLIHVDNSATMHSAVMDVLSAISLRERTEGSDG
jgi:energy-coupling factor transporter ATP-binding protein EcfA2